MDVFLKFLIFGGKYLSQLTAQSIVEAYRRSVQLGRALTLNAEHAVVVVSHYDNVLELYQKNLEEFEALPHAHLAFISEQHRQEFEAFMHDSGLVSEEDMLVLFKHGTAADGEVASIGLTYAQQMTQSILGSCGPSKATPRTDCTDSVSEEIPFEDPVDVDYTNQENVKSYNCLSPRPVHAFSIFKETEPDGALNSVAEYLDRQAEYIKCANDTFKELQVDIANKYAQMQAQAVKQHEEDLEREKAFAHKLKTVQQEVENCTKLMKKAQNHFDIDDEDHKTKRLFGSIDKIIEDVESITQLMKVNEEHFEKCENLKLMQEKGSTDVDSLQVMDANLQAYNKFVCQNLGQQVKQYTRNTLPMLPAVSTSGLTPIEDNIMKFLSRNKHTDTEREKIMEINQKEFEKAEKTLKYPLIGRWNNHLKKCRKTTNLTREKDRKARRKRNNLSIKKSYKGSKSWMSRSRFLGTFPYKSADDMRVSNFAALSTTWINDEPDAGPMYNINNAITRFINRQSKPNVSHIEKHRTVDESLMVVDEKLDYLVEKLLDNIDGNVESSKMPENAQGNKFVGLYSANATDELKMKAFSEIKKEIVSNLQCLRDMKVSEKVDPIAHDIGPIRDYSNMGAQIQQAVDIDYLQSESESPVLFDGIPVELPSDDFDTAMDEFTAQVARNNSMQKRSHQATESEIRELEAVRQMVSEEAVKHQAALEDVRVDAGLEAQRIEAKRALQAAKVARKEAAFDASKVAYQKALDAERVNDNTVRIDITQDTNVSSTFQPRVVHTVSDDICDICADINFDPVQIEIEAPSQVRLHISLSPDVDQSATVDLIETVAPHHREHNEINAKALMKDILTEMNEKEAVYDWQTNNKLLQLAREMNHAAAIKNRHCKEQQAAGKQLHEIMNIDNVETVIESTPSAKQSLAELKNHESNDPANLNLTMNTLKWVNELIHRNNDNPMLGTDGTSVKNVSVFKKSHAETKKRWNKWKNLQPKYRKVKKSYTVVKTRNSEITLQDMINGGSRILNSSVEKLPGTRHISFKKSSENVVKRLKPSTACTTLRKQSSDIKLIPMNLLRPNIQQQSANDDDLIDNKLRLTEKMKSCNLNQYRVESAKAFKPVKFEETPKEEVKIKEPSTSTKKPMYTVHLEKVTEGSSIKSVSDNQAIQFFKQPKKNSLFLDKIPEVPEDKGRDLKITLVQTSVKPEKSEKIANTEEVTENGTTKINEVNSFNAMSKIKAIRKTYEKSMRRSLRTAVLAPDVSRKDAYTSLNQNLAQKLMPKDPKSKNSHNASIDAVNQQTEAGSAVKAQAQEIPPAPPPTPRSPRKTQSFFPAKAVKTEAPVISLKRFQSQTEQLCAPSTEQLRESAKKKRLEKLHNLAIKPPKPVETLSRPSKSEDSIRTKDTISMDSYNPESQTRLVQITPTYILEEPIGKKKKVYEPSTNPYETDKDITVNIRIPEQGSMEDVCDYDVTYKHEVADVSMANPSNQKHIDPLIKRAVETYHMANNEESFKRSQIGSKFLIDYDKSVAKSESFGMRGPQNATDSIADDVSISINIEECDQRPECVSDADLGHRNRYMKHLQRRNQSSVSESRLTPPHSSYAKMRPKLDQLPDLEVIAEQIASENNSRKEQAAADLRAKSEENSETDKSYLNVKGIISPRDMMEPSCAAVKTPPQPVESDQRPQRFNYSKDEFKTQDMDDYAPMAGSDMNSIDEDPTGKVELLNPHTHERVLYNFSTDDSHASLSHAENYQKINENNVHAIQERIDKDDKVRTASLSNTPALTKPKSKNSELNYHSQMQHSPMPHRPPMNPSELAKHKFPIPAPRLKFNPKAKVEEKASVESEKSVKLTEDIKDARVSCNVEPEIVANKPKQLKQVSNSPQPTPRMESQNISVEAVKKKLKPTMIRNKSLDKPDESVTPIPLPSESNNVMLKPPSESSPREKSIKMIKIPKVEMRKNVELKETPQIKRATTAPVKTTTTPQVEAKDDLIVETLSIRQQSPRSPRSHKFVLPRKTPKFAHKSERTLNQNNARSVKVEAPRPNSKHAKTMNSLKDKSSVHAESKTEAKQVETKNQKEIQPVLSATSKSLVKIDPSTASKPYVDMSAVAGDMIRTGANIQYLNELSSELKNSVYNDLLEKCYPKEKQQSDNMKTSKDIIKMQALLKNAEPSQVKPKVVNKTQPSSTAGSPRGPRSGMVYEKAETPETFFVQPAVNTNVNNNEKVVKQTFPQARESFIAVDELPASAKPVIKTYSKKVIDNLRNMKKELIETPKTASNRKEVKSDSVLKQKQTEKKAKVQAKYEGGYEFPEVMKLKASERERNLKRLIILEEKMKKLEAKRSTKIGKEVNSPLDKSLANVLDDMRYKKSSKYPETTVRRIGTFKETSAAGTQYRKSYSNINSKENEGGRSRDGRKQRSMSKGASQSEDLSPYRNSEVKISRLHARSASAPIPKKVAKQEQETEKKVSGKKSEPMEEFISVPKLNIKGIKKLNSTTSNTTAPPTEQQTKINPNPKTYEEVPPAVGQWKLPPSRRKNLLPNIPELQNVEVVVPKNSASTKAAVLTKRPLSPPPAPPMMPTVPSNIVPEIEKVSLVPSRVSAVPEKPSGSASPRAAGTVISISPTPFCAPTKYGAAQSLHPEESRFFQIEPPKPDEYAELPSVPAASSDPQLDAKLFMPYAFKAQKTDDDDPKSQTSQFDQKKTKTLKVFQNQVKQTIKAMEEKVRERDEREKVYTFNKKTINAFTNTFGRHLVRLKTESNHGKKNAEEYHKALSEKLQRMSSLPRVKESVEASKTFIYKPPIRERAGIRETKKPSLSEVKRLIIRHLKETSPSQQVTLKRSNATA